MILVDTSAWIEFDHATNSSVHQRLKSLLAGDQQIGATQPIIMEVTAGATDNRRERDLRRLLLRCTLLEFDAVLDFDSASRIYRTCRRAGFTPRGMIDCMIAAVAQRNDASLLACDRDLLHIARIVGISVDPASGST